MTTIDLGKIFQTVYGPTGIPFPAKQDGKEPSVIASSFVPKSLKEKPQTSLLGTKMYSINNQGYIVFMPVFLDNNEIPNATISFTGEKGIVETDLVATDKTGKTQGLTVFEQTMPASYTVNITTTVFSEDGNNFPEKELKYLIDLYNQTGVYWQLRCALTDSLLRTDEYFVFTKMNLPDMQGIENCQVVEFEGRITKELELEIIGN